MDGRPEISLVSWDYEQPGHYGPGVRVVLQDIGDMMRNNIYVDQLISANNADSLINNQQVDNNPSPQVGAVEEVETINSGPTTPQRPLRSRHVFNESSIVVVDSPNTNQSQGTSNLANEDAAFRIGADTTTPTTTKKRKRCFFMLCYLFMSLHIFFFN